MYKIGREELAAAADVLRSGKLFRYEVGNACAQFETRYAGYLGVSHCMLSSSGTTALTAALVGAGIGPGDEVLVPACTYIATAVSVLAAGAIPVVVDVDASVTISPAAIDAAVGPRTRAVIPVHMWGLPCDMDAILAIAGRRRLIVVEDACQAVGGGYKGRKLGSIGLTGAFSFNYYKNMTCGEGGAAVTSDPAAFDRIRCMIDCNRFYWEGRASATPLFVSNGSRASEIEGAILNAQLDRIDRITAALRRQKARILRATRGVADLTPIPAHSPADECGTHVMYTLPEAAAADRFAAAAGGVVAGKTGRHVYTEWDPIFAHQGAHHPALNPFLLAENRECRMTYTREMCAPSLEILNRTVMLRLDPFARRPAVDQLVERISQAAVQAG